MGLFNWGKDQESAEEEEPQVTLYSPQMLAKRLLWDIVPCDAVAVMVPLMNLLPSSEEVDEMEHQASHERMENVRQLMPLIETLTPLVSGITASAMLVNSGVNADAELALALKKQHSQVVRASSIAILANLLDMGIITYTDGVQLG